MQALLSVWYIHRIKNVMTFVSSKKLIQHNLLYFCNYLLLVKYVLRNFVKKTLRALLSMRLEGEETLKYRCVCRLPCGKV